MFGHINPILVSLLLKQQQILPILNFYYYCSSNTNIITCASDLNLYNILKTSIAVRTRCSAK